MTKVKLTKGLLLTLNYVFETWGIQPFWVTNLPVMPNVDRNQNRYREKYLQDLIKKGFLKPVVCNADGVPVRVQPTILAIEYIYNARKPWGELDLIKREDKERKTRLVRREKYKRVKELQGQSRKVKIKKKKSWKF